MANREHRRGTGQATVGGNSVRAGQGGSAKEGSPRVIASVRWRLRHGEGGTDQMRVGSQRLPRLVLFQVWPRREGSYVFVFVALPYRALSCHASRKNNRQSLL
jgi:hypothetical protein